MLLRVTDGAPSNLSYPYTDALEPGDTFEVDDDKGAALRDRHDYLEAVDPGDKAELTLDEGEYTELCGTEMSDGSTCDRPADDCPYH